MSDAWIISDDDTRASDTARAVSELGFRPMRILVNGSFTPESEDGPMTRTPAVAIVIGSPDSMLMLRNSTELKEVPVLLSVEAQDMEDITELVDVDELLVTPFSQAELKTRIARARRQVNGIEADDVVRIDTLEIDLATYQVTISGEPVDFTYMEYELLKFLTTHPHRVFSREALLSSVWGYDYYGGARTVDVHVRRVRAKLGAEHAARLVTVRSVGYRFEV